MFNQARKKLGRIANFLQKDSIAVRRGRYEELCSELRKSQPKKLAGYGYKVFSQSDEDGVINEVFRRIGTTNKTFVEFGVGDGLENNSLALLYAGWRGLWIEGSPEYCRKIESGLAPAVTSGQLKLINSFVTPDNIDNLIASAIPKGEIDMLSVDIDGNDVHVLERITCVNPRVIVVEYNAKFGPSISYCMQYDGSYIWRKTDRFGASLKYFEIMLKCRGYSCVGCNVVGTNAFFVRDDLLADHFHAPFTAEAHFEPARYELVGLPSGHPCSYDTFKTRVL